MDDGPVTHTVGAFPQATPNEGSQHPPHLPGIAQGTLGGSPPSTSNENRKDPLVNGPPIPWRPTVVSITSGEHSQRQRSPPLRDSSVEEDGRSTSHAHNSSTSLTFTELANQYTPHVPPSPFDKGDPEAGRWTHWGQGPKYPPGTYWIHWEYRKQVTPMCPVGIGWVHFKRPLPWDSNLPRPEHAGYI